MSQTQQQPTQQRAVTAPKKEDSTPLREVQTIGGLFSNEEFKTRMKNALPKAIPMTMMLSSLAGALRKSPLLGECSVPDVAGKVLMLAQVGLPPDTPLQLAHLIPFKETYYEKREKKERMVCQVVLGYHGLLDLAYRSGKVINVNGRTAWRDEVEAGMFSYQFGTDEKIRHIQSDRQHDCSPQAQANGTAEFPAYAYAIAGMADSSIRPFDVWPMSKVLAIRDASPAYRFAAYQLEENKKKGWSVPQGFLKAPWVAHLEAMAAKTMAKRVLNWLPRSVEYAIMSTLDDMQDRQPIDMGPVIESTDYVSAAADAAEISGDPGATFGVRGEPEDEGQGSTGGQQQTATAGTTGQQQPATEQTGRAATTRPARAATKKAAAAADSGPPAGNGGDPGWQPPGVAQAGGNTTGAATAGAAGGASSPAASAPSQPAPAGDDAPSSAGASDFDGWLLDEQGEPIGDDPFTDPIAFARSLEEAWASSANKARILAENADAMQAASAASQPAAKIIASLQEPETSAEAAAEEAVEPETVELKAERGKVLEKDYIVAFRQAVQRQTADSLLAFVANNRPNLMRLPPSSRNVCLSSISKRADDLGMQRPNLGDMVSAPAEKPADETERQYELDRQATAQRIAELRDCKALHEVKQWAEGPIMQAFGRRLKAEGKTDLVDQLNAAYNGKIAEFAPRPAQATS